MHLCDHQFIVVRGVVVLSIGISRYEPNNARVEIIFDLMT